METFNKISLLNKMDISCDMDLGSFEERINLMDELERHYQPDVYKNYNLLRKLLTPVLIAEYAKPKIDHWTDMQKTLKERTVLGYSTATLGIILVAGLFWTSRK
ncbi:unnamed protein product [Auanema sp. JU1783]|nr:unnamed protein product [Auanema sp. JU1783]